MKMLLVIALAGALGTMARYAMGFGIHNVAGHSFPYGTLTVNVVGSLVIGILYVVIVESGSGLVHYRAPLMLGFLGAFTTFSAFSLETIQLMEAGNILKASANVLLNVVLCLVACWGGLAIGRYQY